MSKVKLPQLYAIYLEMILAKGLATLDIFELLQSENDVLLKEKVNAELNWERMLDYAADNWTTLESAILHGYTFSFITIGGIKSLLAIKFSKHEDENYQFNGEQIEGLRLTSAEYDILRDMVPLFWDFIGTDTELPSDVREITIKHSSMS